MRLQALAQLVTGIDKLEDGIEHTGVPIDQPVAVRGPEGRTMSEDADKLRKAALRHHRFQLSVADAQVWLKRGEALGRWLNLLLRHPPFGIGQRREPGRQSSSHQRHAR